MALAYGQNGHDGQYADPEYADPEVLPVGQDFEFIDDAGHLRWISSFRPDITAVFFGYSNCPDVCTGFLAKLASVRVLLGPRANNLRVIFVTVDPDRDTRTVLAKYLSLFGEDFIGARLPPGELESLAKSFAIYYRRIDISPNYLVGHSDGLFLFNRRGLPAQYLSRQSTIDEIKKSILKLQG